MSAKRNESDDRTVTIQSNRIYLNSIKKEEQDLLLTSIREFNILREWLYNRSYDAQFLGTGKEPAVAEIHQKALDLFGHDISGYTVTSLYSTAHGMISSQKELQQLYTQDQTNRIANRKKKIYITQDELNQQTELKNLLVQFHRKHKRYPTSVEIEIPKRLKSRYPSHETCVQKGTPPRCTGCKGIPERCLSVRVLAG